MSADPAASDGFMASFAYPFRGGWGRSWLVGVLLVLLCPLGMLPLLGYLVRAVRAASIQPDTGPPSWRPDRRLLRDGVQAGAALALPVALWGILFRGLAPPAVSLSHRVVGSTNHWVGDAVTGYLVGLAIAAPIGLILLIVAPPLTARYALTGRLRDLFDLARALATVRQQWQDWNLVAVTILTAWALAVAGSGLLCVGVLPATYYALLVSAHATARFSR